MIEKAAELIAVLYDGYDIMELAQNKKNWIPIGIAIASIVGAVYCASRTVKPSGKNDKDKEDESDGSTYESHDTLDALD